MKFFVAIFAVAMIALAFSAEASNLLVEGGNFETGMEGFSIRPVLLVRNWPTFVPPSIDASTAGEGARSLKLVNGSTQDVFEIHSRVFEEQKPTHETRCDSVRFPTIRRRLHHGGV